MQKQIIHTKQSVRLFSFGLWVMLMLLLPATLAYSAYLPLFSAPNTLSFAHNQENYDTKASQNDASQLTFDCTAVSEIPQIECEALVTLYKSTNGANWSNNSDWLNTTTPVAGMA